MNNKTKAILICLFAVLAISTIFGIMIHESPLFTSNPKTMGIRVGLNCYVTQRDPTGKLISFSHHPMSLVFQGPTLLSDTLFGYGFGYNFIYIGLSNSTTAFSNSWDALPSEYVAYGLSRASAWISITGAYTELTKIFTATAIESVNLYGLYGSASGNYLLAAEQQGIGNRKNLGIGDTLNVTITITVSGS